MKKDEIYDGIFGFIEPLKDCKPRQKDLLGAKIRLAVGEDNTVFVRAISVIRKGKDFKGDECPVFHNAKINIQKPEKEYQFEPILK